MARVSRIIVCVGLLLILHAAYSAVQHRSFLKLAEEEFTSLPSDIALECLLASVMCAVGVFSMMGKFRDIQLTTELNTKSFETVANRSSFMTFNHRGRVLYQSLR